MNRKVEILIQELFLAIVNGNTERAEKLIRQMPFDSIEKVAYGGWDAINFALRFLPAGVGEEVKEKIKERAAGAAA